MIADEDRGSAWTNALLGLQAQRIHLCGDPRALDLVQKFCQLTGDTITERRYDRLSRVHIIKKEFSLEKDLQPGDCIISFSTKKVIRMKNVKSPNDLDPE